jgi:hypothetical protein
MNPRHHDRAITPDPARGALGRKTLSILANTRLKGHNRAGQDDGLAASDALIGGRVWRRRDGLSDRLVPCLVRRTGGGFAGFCRLVENFALGHQNPLLKEFP